MADREAFVAIDGFSQEQGVVDESKAWVWLNVLHGYRLGFIHLHDTNAEARIGISPLRTSRIPSRCHSHVGSKLGYI